MQQPAPIFALDIGTRSIVGILAYPEGDKLNIASCEVFEHQERSMLDGQIHDVLKVASIIKAIKQKIEDEHSIQLTHAAVAAAGRSLKTVRTTLTHSIKDKPFTSRDEVIAFELEAVQQAQKMLVKENEGVDKTKYHCVGYSIVEYAIDGSPIASIIDQYGEQAKIDVIATFLPRVVVDSLQAALERADLEISALTLEPIAAINVLIPPTMRKLNLALVDIGAGTSDIAITAEGTITAYDMVPSAGDEITEAISQKYLLDFNVAEALKRSLREETVTYEDVLGFSYEKASKEIISEIREHVDVLANQIAERILSLNKVTPQAIMLVGGGSMTPLLPEILAQKVSLPKERVAVRGAEAISNLIGQHEILKGPEAVTPVGIVVSALAHHIDFINIKVNNKKVRVFDLKKLTVGDALIAAGIDMHKLHGKPGMALSVEVNGSIRIIRGKYGTPPLILLNNEPATLDTIIKEDDQLIIEPGMPGADATGTIADILKDDELAPLQVVLKGQSRELPVLIFYNGKPATIDQQLADRASIICHPPSTVKECFEAVGITDYATGNSDMSIVVNGQTKLLPGGKSEIFLNDQIASLSTRVRPNDNISMQTQQHKAYKLYDVIEPELIVGYEVNVKVNGSPVTLYHPGIKILNKGNPTQLSNEVADKDVIEVVRNNHIQLMFNDIFKFIDIMAKKPKDSSRLKMLLNGSPATFDAPLKTGDTIDLTWEEN
ncbi:cell division protein FtsA [Desulfuribacillus alkaliarsenatis]|uniref:SHS2 domain-containing protein n=1 Tax=Desulfuribacillus alkaliarsenatis TaxID=766136 RepID=A0A1E5G650_9FIRM|nr:cell division FtsA domain-containing protein [Desulfuribacillus alkaliarsenatis]OEF98244.1 hypothetical protein BHF68_00735 [Desulfuribacillus alkaliarsenatis]